jgi:hypothetical protein
VKKAEGNCVMYILGGFIFRIYKELLQTARKKIAWQKNGQEI